MSIQKYRRLNNGQITVLEWLLKFRFSTSRQLAASLDKPNHKAIQSKLQLLETQGLISKRYDSSYKLAGQPAEYFLTPKGARLLEATTQKPIHPLTLKSLYKNPGVSQKFVHHCLLLTDVALCLEGLYATASNEFTIHTVSTVRDFIEMPRWSPDLFIIFDTDNTTECAFIDVWDDTRPFFVSVKKVHNYLQYLEDGDWMHDELNPPAVLSICRDDRTQIKLARQISRKLEDLDEASDTPCATTTLAELTAAKQSDEEYWQMRDWSGETYTTSLEGIYTYLD